MNREINIRLNANRAKAVHTGYKFASGDKGIVFKIAVDELDTTDTTAKIVFMRSNGTSVEAGIVETEGVYSYTTLGNEFAVVGQVVADVKFYENENRISTCTFVFDVTSDTMDGLCAGTAGYSDTLEKIKKEMEEILEQMRGVMDEAEEDVEAAERKMSDLTAELEALYQEYVAAFGSTGPFNPRGPYSETETYTVRDLVTYDDASWVCYRNCTGATPSKDSDCWQDFAVGNALTLDGHGVEYFVEKGIYLTTSILEKALTLSNGVHNFVLAGGGNYTGNDLPSVMYSYGNATVVRRGNDATVILWGRLDSPIAVNYYGGEWSGWLTLASTADLANYLPLTGGTLEAPAPHVMGVKNTTGTDCYINFNGKDGLLGYLGFYGNQPVYIDGVTKAMEWLLHAGNKPTGTYTGNGDAALRTINVGGIGNMVLLRNSANNDFVLVTGSGYIGKQGTSFVCGSAVSWTSSNGNLYIASTSALLNENGVRYLYYLL